MATDEAVQYRNKVVEELTMTESTYLNGLQKLITHFIDPLESDGKVINNADFHIIFPKDIKTIYNLHQTLFTQFQREYQRLHECNATSKTNIGRIFIEHAQHFKMYQNYLNNHHKAVQRLTTLQSNKKFSKWCAKARSKINNQTLSSLLILPIQRLSRYELLLNELIKRTQKLHRRHKDLDDLRRALEQINEINKLINHRMKQHERREKVCQIKNKFEIDSLCMEIIEPSRYFIMDNLGNEQAPNEEHVITKHDKFGKTMEIYLVLFNDGLIYGHSRSVMLGSSAKWIFDNFLPFDSVFGIEDVGQIYKQLHCLKLLSSTESIWISLKSLSYKLEWIQQIEKALRVKLSKDRNIRKSNACQLIQSVCLIPDDYSNHCMECDAKFSVTNRRHHCYNSKCGKLVCGQCSDFQISDPKAVVVPEQTGQIRVCRTCYVKHQQESVPKLGFVERMLKYNLHIIMIIVIVCIVFNEQCLSLLHKLIRCLKM